MVTGGRVALITPTGKNSLRLAVGHVRQAPAVNLVKVGGSINGIPEKLIDSVLLSEDGGQTWTREGAAFAGDTIVKMQWLSPTDGFVLSYNIYGTYVTQYRRASESGVEHSFQDRVLSLNTLNIYPVVATSKLSYRCGLETASLVEIYNSIGVLMYSERRQMTGNVYYDLTLPSNLQEDCYYLRITDGTTSIGQWFTKM